ncbi:hypothetical protein SDC9_189069 [bioreactor metagenome]|uniref:Uncharacterized protein n=1 Tax=bioreactor metagenome TaxID=1076179 RepID=A0A645HRD7_9ZZZZ
MPVRAGGRAAEFQQHKKPDAARNDEADHGKIDNGIVYIGHHAVAQAQNVEPRVAERGDRVEYAVVDAAYYAEVGYKANHHEQDAGAFRNQR